MANSVGVALVVGLAVIVLRVVGLAGGCAVSDVGVAEGVRVEAGGGVAGPEPSGAIR